MRPDERWPEVSDLLSQAFDLDPDERPRFLVEACGTDDALRRRLERLLAADEQTEDFISRPIFSLHSSDDQEAGADRIGPYRLVRPLGHGGMGAVYLAERDDGEFEQTAAIKLLRPGFDSAEILSRFRAERQILAKLTHPNVSRLLEGGTDDGRPYFVMEYVDGKPIDEFCDRRRLSVHQRVELFRSVCEAVHFAHRNLVVHRDLKPGNILVTADGTAPGRVKLLDFGIAKLLRNDPQLSYAELAHTGTLQPPPMTPFYASPEQVQGEPVSTASDVYSLGVVLYQLLTGHRPHRFETRAPQDIARTICEQTPRRPSAVVQETRELRHTGGRRRVTPEAISEQRRSDPKKLCRELTGDLDNIVMTALRKEPERRFSSVQQLSEDLGRYLEGLPVRSGPDTFRYRAGKLVRRHRFALATAAAFVVVVIGFVVALLLQVERIRTERDRADRSRDLFVEIIEKTDPVEEEEILTPEGVVKRGIDLFGESFAQEYEVQAAILDSLGRVYARRGYYGNSRPLLESSLEMRRKAFGDDHLLVAESRLNLAYSLGKSGEYEKAAELSRLGLEKLRRYHQDPHIDLARAISNYATQLSRLERFEEAESLYRKSHDMRTALYGDVHLSVATSLDALGSLHQQRRNFDEALENYRRSREIREQLLPPKHPEIALSYGHVGTVLYEQGAYTEAEPMLRQALLIYREKYGGQHIRVATTRYRLALALQKMTRYDEAEPLFRQALATRCATLGEDHLECANVKSELAKLLVVQGNLQAAEILASQALATYENKGNALRAAVVKVVLGECLAAGQRYEEAEALMLEGYAFLHEALGEKERVTEEARRALVGLYEAWDKPARIGEGDSSPSL